MTKQTKLAGNFAFPNTSVSVYRMGYGAMQLAGPGVWGPPRNVDAAVAVLREATAAGVNHIDTSDFYGPHVTNQIIKQALYPYPNDLVIVSKVGYRRGTDKSWLHAVSPQELIDAVHDNLRNLGLSALDLVNLRVGGVAGPTEGSIEEPMTVLAELKRKGLIRHLGVSNVTSEQLDEARRITDIACVQNFYNIANRNDDAFIDRLATEGIPYVPFFRWEDSRRYSHRFSIGYPAEDGSNSHQALFALFGDLRFPVWLPAASTVQDFRTLTASC